MKTRIELQSQQLDLKPFTGSLHMDVTFYEDIPSFDPFKKDLLDKTYSTSKPSLSNLVNFIEQVGKSIIFSDASCVVSSTCKKVYDKNPRTEFTISRINDEL